MKKKVIFFTDAQLIVQFQNGDVKGFNALELRHGKKLIAFLFKHFHSIENCKDACQKFWLSAVIKFLDHTYIEKNHFLQWMQTSAFHIYLNDHRNDNKKAPIEKALDKPAPINEEDNSTTKEKVAALRKLFSKLTPRMKDMLIMHYINGIKWKVIGKKYKNSANSIRSECSKVMKTLKRKLSKK